MKRFIWIGSGILLLVFLGVEFFQISHFFQKKCAFYRQGRCISCSDSIDIPVGFKENCNVCPERSVKYIGEGIAPVWICQSLDAYTRISGSQVATADVATIPCPEDKPLKDLVGNCYACDTPEPVRVAHWSRASMCFGQRYFVLNTLSEKSMLCPKLPNISNPEICDMCQGGWIKNKCLSNTKSRYCQGNGDCLDSEWCYPFMIERNEHQGICTQKSDHQKWLCSTTDGYSRSLAEKFCVNQGGRLPNLDDLMQDKSGALSACPYNDMWTFFDENKAMYMDYLDKEFLITRDAEIGDYGQANFYALCIMD
ncbi:MAG: hypothetical protein J6Y85_01510 [Alphaproteobacteria bacterium]|nr:hypothetical protein [Alphaproteobacteria bacterium]